MLGALGGTGDRTELALDARPAGTAGTATTAAVAVAVAAADCLQVASGAGAAFVRPSALRHAYHPRLRLDCRCWLTLPPLFGVVAEETDGVQASIRIGGI